jgi:hypothetical protein
MFRVPTIYIGSSSSYSFEPGSFGASIKISKQQARLNYLLSAINQFLAKYHRRASGLINEISSILKEYNILRAYFFMAT